MSKTLYEEALADARKLKEVAEDNAKRLVFEAVQPRIRELIEKRLFEDLDLEADVDDDEENILLDLNAGDVAVTDSSAVSLTVPDEDVKVSLDLDFPSNEKSHECTCGCHAGMLGAPLSKPAEEPELELSVESLINMFSGDEGNRKLSEAISNIEVEVKRFISASKVIKETVEFRTKIEELIEQIQDTYTYVQEHHDDATDKAAVETRLEGFFKDMKGLKESAMKSVKDLMKEGDLTIKLTGLPTDLDDEALEQLGIDIVAGDEDDELGVGELEPAVGDEAGGEGEDFEAPVDDGELTMADAGDEDADDLEDLDDDDVVEISESMLKSEIARMRSDRLKKEGKIPVDDFGGGCDEGDPWLDGEVTTKDNEKVKSSGVVKAPSLKESDEDDDCDELDEGVAQNQEEDADTFMSAGQASDQKNEALVTRIRQEIKLQKESIDIYNKCLTEASKVKGTKKATLYVERAKKEAAKVKSSKKRVADLKAKKAKKNVKEGVENQRSVQVAEDRNIVESLRGKLNESNLFNAKLLATNKLLQNESLSAKQKSSAVERLDEAKTVREVKLVYESIVKALYGRRSLEESKTVIGSSSRATAPGAKLTESVSTESDRWARLAGIK